nr:alpha/beta hydrolase [Fodinicola feengrottensis]
MKSPDPDALPLILTHGWPCTSAEYLDVIEPLTHPTEGPSYHLVIPSLPGYGFSGPTKERGWHSRRIAAAWAELMRRLGYSSYGVVGNDIGSQVSVELGRLVPEQVVGVHVQQIWSFPLSEADRVGLSEQDLEYLEGHETFERVMGAYNMLQSQQPQTLAHALADSPAGLLAWKSQLQRALDADFILTNVMIYWLTGTAGSAMRLYFEQTQLDAGPRPEPTTVPVGLAQFADDFHSMRRFSERDHKNIVSWHSYEQGGHWAAHEAPDVLVADIREFFRQLRAKMGS